MFNGPLPYMSAKEEKIMGLLACQLNLPICCQIQSVGGNMDWRQRQSRQREQIDKERERVDREIQRVDTESK